MTDQTPAAGDDPAALHRDALAVLQPGFTGTEPPAWLTRRLREGLTSVALFGRNVESPRQLAALTAGLREANPDLLVAVDEEGGDVTRLEAARGSSWPGNRALGAVDDPDLTRRVAAELGRSLAACGVNLDWAPSADVNCDPANPVIGVRSFGADPELVARHTAAWVDGLQSTGTAACAKHFPGHGDTSVDSHHGLPVVDVPLQTLRARELPPFRAAVRAGTAAVMTAHIVLPALDPRRPATLSAPVVRLLREELGFTGPVITDGIEMGAVAETYGVADGAVRAIAAGVDAVCVGGGLADEETVLLLRDALAAAVRDGTLPRQRLAEAADRVRALAAAHRVDPSAPRPAPDPAVGLEAARRALRLSPFTPLAPDGPAPHVVRLTPAANIAVGGETAWGLDAALRERFPDTRTEAVAADRGASGDPSRIAADVLAGAGNRRIVLVVRDAHRHGWMARLAAELADRRPDTVVVEMGLGEFPGAHVATRGAARACSSAAAEALTNRPDGP